MRVGLTGLTIAEDFRDRGGKTSYYSSTTFSVLHRQDLRYLPYLDECQVR